MCVGGCNLPSNQWDSCATDTPRAFAKAATPPQMATAGGRLFGGDVKSLNLLQQARVRILLLVAARVVARTSGTVQVTARFGVVLGHRPFALYCHRRTTSSR